MRTEMADLRGELKGGMQTLRGELSTIKWMGGVLIALAAAILARAPFV